MTDLAMILGLINYVFVLFFGIVVSLYLADINFMDHKVLYFCTLLGFGAAEGIFYLFMGESLPVSYTHLDVYKRQLETVS